MRSRAPSLTDPRRRALSKAAATFNRKVAHLLYTIGFPSGALPAKPRFVSTSSILARMKMGMRQALPA